MEKSELVWLPQSLNYSFRADPFAIWRDEKLYVFVEAMDYRYRIGKIEVLVYDRALNLCSVASVLSEPWHLSYPFVFEDEGDTWMLPEAYRSGSLTLYRAVRFPHIWEPAYRIQLDGPAIDATPFKFSGRWWILYAPSADPLRRTSLLHAAWAHQLAGPWHLHPSNPVRDDPASTRPAGRPSVRNGVIKMPVQDCRFTYGGATRSLYITDLSEDSFKAHDKAWLSPSLNAHPFTDGLHTVSSAGPVTLVDFKLIEDSWRGNIVRLKGVLSRHLRERLG